MTQSLTVLSLKVCPLFAESFCSWKRVTLHEIQTDCAKLLTAWEKPSLKWRKQRGRTTPRWKEASVLGKGSPENALVLTGNCEQGDQEWENHLYQREEVRGMQSLNVCPFPALSFCFFKVTRAPLGWQIGGRLGITVYVNESGCRTHGKSHCPLDSLIIGSHWLSHSIIYITEDYQQPGNAFSFPLLLLSPSAQKWLSLSFCMNM